MDIAGRHYGPPLPMRYDESNEDDDSPYTDVPGEEWRFESQNFPVVLSLNISNHLSFRD